MDEQGGLFGPMMRHGDVVGQHAQCGGTSPVEWAILGLAIAILVLVILILVDGYRHRHHHTSWNNPGGPGDPLENVRLRYSRGELSREQYLQAVEDLGARQAAPATKQAAEGGAPPRRRGRRQQP